MTMNECAVQTCEYCDETIAFGTECPVETFGGFDAVIHDYCNQEFVEWQVEQRYNQPYSRV